MRHESWYDSEVYDVLRARGEALCITDAEDVQTPLQATAEEGYLRLRGVQYTTEADLRRWRARITAQSWRDVFVFFKHGDETTGPRSARQFISMLPA